MKISEYADHIVNGSCKHYSAQGLCLTCVESVLKRVHDEGVREGQRQYLTMYPDSVAKNIRAEALEEAAHLCDEMADLLPDQSIGAKGQAKGCAKSIRNLAHQRSDMNDSESQGEKA